LWRSEIPIPQKEIIYYIKTTSNTSFLNVATLILQDNMENITTDIELWLGIKNADVKAFSLLMDRYWPILFHKAKSRINDDEVAKDLVQEILISVWIKRERLPLEILPQAYLYAALKYKILNFVSYSHLRLKNANLILEKQQAQQNLTPEDVIDVKELKNAIHKSTAVMTNSMRDIFELSYKEGLSIAEIALKKGISAQSVKNYLYEAKCILRKNLSTYITPEHFAGLMLVILMKD